MAQFEALLCFNCGFPMSDRIELFRELRDQYLTYLHKQKGFKYDPKTHNSKKMLLPDPDEEIMPVFEALSINRLCCRTHINNAVSMTDLISFPT
jgi:DNA-directed RNA polymerase subunit N (RpoN/RPB10)